MLCLIGGGCASEQARPAAAPTSKPSHNHATHDHSAGDKHSMEGMEGMQDEHRSEKAAGDGSGHEAGHGAGHEAGHGSHLEPTALTAMLVHASDLPEGYTAGAHHAAPTGSAPSVGDACAPIADLIGTHPSVESAHPHAETSFSKSHFGPQVTETVLDLAEPEAASDAVSALAAAGTDCERYEQLGSGPGVTAYDVAPARLPDGISSGTTLRLDARGSDFTGISWHLWADDVDGRLVAVSLRTAKGGNAEDLTPAISSAMSALDRA